MEKTVAGFEEEHDAAEEAALRWAVLAGDESAWRTLYDRCYGPLYGYVHAKTWRHTQRTEEVVQETWLIAVRRIRRFDPERAPFIAWLRGIAEGVLRNHARKWQRQSRMERPMEEAPDIQLAPIPDVAEAEHVAETLGSLPEDYRDALEAKYGEGWSVAEMAAQRNRSPKAVESLLSRARAAFRKAYGKIDGE